MDSPINKDNDIRVPVYLDNIIFRLQNAGGISLYWFELISGFQKKQIKYQMIDVPGVKGNIYHRAAQQTGKVKKEREILPLKISRFLPFFTSPGEQAIFHSSYFRISPYRKSANIVTVYDFIYEKYLRNIKRTPHILQKKYALKRADGIIAISEHTRQDMLNTYPFLEKKKTVVIPLGVSRSFFRTQGNSDANDINEVLNKKYILFVGSRAAYKNFDIVVDIVAEQGDLELVLVGGGRLAPSERNELSTKLKNKYFHFLDLKETDLNLLYNNAFCLLYPSSYEGFGLPLLEAMSAGCPVVSVQRSCIPEVCGDGALLSQDINSNSLNDLVDKLRNTTVRNDLIALGEKRACNFTWEKCIDATLDFYSSVCEHKFYSPSSSHS